MSNSIALITKYLDKLDLVYKQAAKSAIFEADSSMVQQTMEANIVKIAKISMDGLGDYSRENGYAGGSVTLAWETHTFTNDRGRMFKVDKMDNVETAGKAFGALAAEFIRTKVVPEIDAYRFAKIASASGIESATATLTSATTKGAIDTAMAALAENEVDLGALVCFMTPTVKGYLESSLNRDLDSGLDRFGQVINYYNGMPIMAVPQTRFYTAIDLLDGKSTGETTGGFKKHALVTGKTGDVAGKDINFIIMDPRAVFAVTKNSVSKVVSPEENQNEDGWRFFFRTYHDLFVLENKVKGIYCHHKA